MAGCPVNTEAAYHAITAPSMKNANSAVASVRTSGVLVKGIRCRLAASRSMLSKPTASWATTFSPAAAAATPHRALRAMAETGGGSLRPASRTCRATFRRHF